jgi:hypothetical protein
MKRVDPFIPVPSRHTPPTQPAIARPQVVKYSARKPYRVRDVLGTIGFLVAVLFVGTIAQTLAVGEAVIAVYAVYALVRHIASRTTFMLALMSLVVVLILRATGMGQLLAANFAVYSLLLAFVGVITLALEVRRSQKV